MRGLKFNMRPSWSQFRVLPKSDVLCIDRENISESYKAKSYDYIICLPSVITYDNDVQIFLSSLIHYCHDRTRLIVLWYRPLFFIGRTFSLASMKLFATLAGFEVVTYGRYDAFHCFLILHQKKNLVLDAMRTVSIVVPCRNERGTVEDAVRRCPLFGKSIELIFVDGYSTDGTIEELYRIQAKYRDKKIIILQQKGKGKGDAVRLGFEHAQGDIVMILDSDLTVSPEELPKFYDALVSGAGECINGSRFLYPMEDKATPWLNYFANRAFAVLVSWIMGQTVTDTLCGTKVLWRKDYEAIAEGRMVFGTIDPFGDFDLLFGAARLGKKIIDVPVHFKNRVYGSSQIGSYVKNGILLLRMCFNALWRFRFQ